MSINQVSQMLQEVGFDTDVNIDYQLFENLVVQDFLKI